MTDTQSQEYTSYMICKEPYSASWSIWSITKWLQEFKLKF